MIKYLYVRPHLKNKGNIKEGKFTINEINGYNKGNKVYSIKTKCELKKKWEKVIPVNKEITAIVLPKDFEYDDIMIFQDNSGDENDLDLNKLLEGVVDKFMENNEGIDFENDGN